MFQISLMILLAGRHLVLSYQIEWLIRNMDIRIYILPISNYSAIQYSTFSLITLAARRPFLYVRI